MTGPICFGRSDLRIDLWHLAVAPGVPKSERNDSFDGLFRAFVHPCTRPRLRPRRDWFAADSCVRERSIRPTFHVRADSFGSPSEVSLRDKTEFRARDFAECRRMPWRTEALTSLLF